MPKITGVSPYFGTPPVVRSPFHLSINRDLHFNSVNLKTVPKAEQEGKLFGRLASVLWVCVPANVLALRCWLLETLHTLLQLLLIFVLYKCVTLNFNSILIFKKCIKNFFVMLFQNVLSFIFV